MGFADLMDQYAPVAQGSAPSAPAPSGGGFRALMDQYAPIPEPKEPGLGEAALRGIKQGVTLGFGDEITGAFEHAFTGKSYKLARDEARAADKAAREAHPIGFGLGQVLGNVGVGAVTGGIAGAAGAGSLAATAGVAGAEGALQGLGESEATTAQGLAKDTAIGGALGAAGGVVGGKLFGRYANTAEERNARHIAEEVTEGANMVNKRRFAQVQELAAEHFDKDPALRRAMKDPGAGLEAVEQRLDALGPQTAPKYATIDANYRPMTAAEVVSPIDKLVAKYEAEPGKETIAGALSRMRDNFLKATAQNGADPATTQVPTALVRKWTSNLLSEADSTMGSLAETERYKIKDQLHDVADGILKNHIEAAAKSSPAVRQAADELRELNKQITVLVKAKDVLNVRNTKEMVGHKGLGDVLRNAGLPALAGLGAAGGDLISGGGAYLATKAAVAGAKMANRSATTALARLMRSARTGSATAQMAIDALKAGVPNATVQAAMGMSGQVMSPPEPEDESGAVAP